MEYEGAFYHVTSRGNLRQNIFFQDADREERLETLSRIKERYGRILHAYVLMNNHYHLLIETPLANLNQLMQNLNTSYTVYVNRKYQRSGHLFQGRYKAIVVDKDNYLLTLSRYIHLNPVRARVAELPEEYQWSSYKEYIGYISTGLVDIRDTLFHFSENAKEAMAAYRNFVESGIEEDERPFKDVRAGIVLGGEIFFEEKIKDMITERSVDRELPALRRLLKETPIEQVVRVVADYYKLYPGDNQKVKKMFQGKKDSHLSVEDCDWREELHSRNSFWDNPSGSDQYT